MGSLNPRECIGFAELVNSVLRCLLRSQRALRIYLRGSEILRSLLRRASILTTHVSTLYAQISISISTSTSTSTSTLTSLHSNLITHPGINDGHIRDRMKTPGFMFSYLAYYENIIIYICNKSKNEDRRF